VARQSAIKEQHRGDNHRQTTYNWARCPGCGQYGWQQIGGYLQAADKVWHQRLTCQACDREWSRRALPIEQERLNAPGRTALRVGGQGDKGG
jgi:hypothetical protein